MDSGNTIPADAGNPELSKVPSFTHGVRKIALNTLPATNNFV